MSPCPRACHRHELYVSHRGEVYPCCISWGNSSLMIGHLGDTDLGERITAFTGECTCANFVLSDAPGGLSHCYKLNIEFSLDCTAQCAMCCAGAPSWKGPYTLYDDLWRLLDLLPGIGHLVVQGGEVLAQEKSLAWVARFRELMPGVPVGVITNGCVSIDMIPRVEGLFENVLVSFYGFQEETYRIITGLPLARTRGFSEELVRRGKTTTHLKYLVTPLNLHEAPLFLRWAASLGPQCISFIDAQTDGYINRTTPDRYWDIIIERTGDALRHELAAAAGRLRERGTTVLVDAFVRRMFGLDAEFIGGSGLTGLVLPNPLVG